MCVLIPGLFVPLTTACEQPADVDTEDPAYPVAVAYCSAFASCDCPGFPNEPISRDDCENQQIAALGKPMLAYLQQRFPGVEFSVDPVCRDDLVAWAEGLQCDGNSTATLSCADWHCIGNQYSGPLTVGQACEMTAQCKSGLYCDGPGGSRVCRDLCASQSPSGGPCGSDGMGCEDGLVCFADHCAQPGAVGDACEEDTCGERLYCADADGCHQPLDAGVACTTYFQCQSNLCLPDGTCAAMGQLGDACDLMSPTARCAEGLSCFEGACSKVPELCTR